MERRNRIRSNHTGRLPSAPPLAMIAAVFATVILLALVAGLSAATPSTGDSGLVPPTTKYYTKVPPGGDVSTYLSGVTRHANNPSETVLNVSNAHSIKQLWAFQANKSVFSQPAVVNGVVYLPTWSGYLDAINLTNKKVLYESFLGTQVGCGGHGAVGMDSSPTLQGSTLFLGAPGSVWLAAAAGNGTPLWNVSGGPASMGFFNWGSPLLVGSEEYVGLSSFCDKPLVPAALLKINISTHHVDAMFNTTLNSTLGASIWSSPSYDAGLNEVFATTGNGGRNQSSHPYAESILAFKASSLQLLGHWRVPGNQTVIDGDFGATPTIYDRGGAEYVAALNKDGYVYAWNARNVTAGPIWETNVSYSDHNIASMSYDGTYLYVGVGATDTIRGHVYNGSLWALNPDTGRVVWKVGLPAPVFTAPYSANGLVVVASGRGLFVLAANNGTILTKLTPATGSFTSAPVLSHGIILAGASNGRLYAYGLPPALLPSDAPAGHLLDGPLPAALTPLLARWA